MSLKENSRASTFYVAGGIDAEVVIHSTWTGPTTVRSGDVSSTR